MNEFERDRALRIEENKRRMVEMGILSLSSKVAADATIKPTPVRDDALSEDRVVAFARSLRLFFPTDRSGFPPMTFVDRFDSKHGISRREFARNTPFYLAIALSRQNTITRSPEIAPTPVSHSAERRKRESSYRSLSVADRRAREGEAQARKTQAHKTLVLDRRGFQIASVRRWWQSVRLRARGNVPLVQAEDC
jgi:hypothetical protein